MADTFSSLVLWFRTLCWRMEKASVCPTMCSIHIGHIIKQHTHHTRMKCTSIYKIEEETKKESRKISIAVATNPNIVYSTCPPVDILYVYTYFYSFALSIWMNRREKKLKMKMKTKNKTKTQTKPTRTHPAIQLENGVYGMTDRKRHAKHVEIKWLLKPLTKRYCSIIKA